MLRPYIDWTPFFMTWELAGKYPKILDDEVVGESARSLFADAQAMLDFLIADGRLQGPGRHRPVALQPVGDDDLVLYDDDDRTAELARLHHLRQQSVKPEGQPNYCLADFVAPPGVADYLGAFAVTAGARHRRRARRPCRRRLRVDHDQSPGRSPGRGVRGVPAPSGAHHYWGYSSEEDLDCDALIREQYQGIRPAPGYPACPEHSEKQTLFRLLDATRKADIELTESFAMLPAASVSGWYFSHPEARYFGVGKIGADQLEDYARRKGIDLESARRLLREPH
jgi:5-methyltetrahydrofolate--homocysteine methyltransferase